MEGNIIITGASGFIGRSLCQELLDRDYHVIGTTRSDQPPDLGIEWRQMDITSKEEVTAALKDATYVFHLAGIGLMDGNANEVWETNVTGTKNVVEAIQGTDCERLVFTSTAGTRHRPGKEAATEDDISNPLGAYQESKREAENIIQNYVYKGGDAVITHPTSVSGPSDPRLTPKLIGLVNSKIPVYLPGGGSVVSVEDVVDGLIKAAERGRTGEHYILGGENLTFEAMLEVIASKTGDSVPPIRVPPVAIHIGGYGVGLVNRLFGTQFFPVNPAMAKISTRYRFYDSQKAIDELGYSITPFSEYIEEAIEWYENSST